MLKYFKLPGLVLLGFTNLAFANNMSYSPALTYASASSKYELIQLGLIVTRESDTEEGEWYLSQKTVGKSNFHSLPKFEYKTNRFGLVARSITSEQEGYGGLYIYANDTDFEYFNKEGLGFELGYVKTILPAFKFHLGGELNIQMLSTDWDNRVPYEYNLNTGLNYSFNRHLELGVFYEHQGYSGKKLTNEVYSVTGFKLKVRM